MKPLHQQLGLDLTRGSEMVVLEVIDKITNELHDYSDNGPLRISFKKQSKPRSANSEVRAATLRALADHGIITYKFDKTHFTAGPADLAKALSVYSVSIINRYNFEQLCTELSQLYDPSTVARAKTPNLVYYDLATGEGTINGKPVKFNRRSKQKAIFDLLFTNAPGPVPREKITAILRLGNSHAQADRLNTAISNLCTKCGVKRDVITVNDSVTLNAVAIPVNSLS